MSVDPAPRPRRAEWPLLVLVAAVFFMALCSTQADPDLWGHLRFGQDTLAQGGVARTDPYSYVTAPGSWVNHEWLAEASFALAYYALGVRGLVALKAVIGLAALAAVFLYARRYSSRLLGPTLVLVVAAVGVLPILRPVRPQLYTVALMTALLLVLALYEQGHRRLLWACAPIMALWVNAHGGVLAGAGLLIGWYGARVLERLWRLREQPVALALRRWREIVAPGELSIVLLSLAATLLNPYGWRLPAFLLRTATGSRPEIQDWQPAALNSYYGVAYLLFLLLAFVVYLKGRRRPSLPQTAILAALALVSLTAVRHVSLFGLAVAILVGPGLIDLLPGRKPAPVANAAHPARRNGSAGRILQGLVILVAAGAVGYGVYLGGRIPVPANSYPWAAVRVLKEHVSAANMVTPYNWGEYVIWHLGPEIKVSMDGRRETVYDDAAYAESMAWHYGRTGWDAQVDDPASDLVLAKVNSPGHSLMLLKPGWALVYQDDLAAIFGREGSDLVEQLRGVTAPPLPEELLFP